MHNGNVLFHTTYGTFVYILYRQNVSVHTIYRKLVHILYKQKIMLIQHLEKLSIYFMYRILFRPYNIWKSFPNVV